MRNDLKQAHDEIRTEATRLAGNPNDLVQRATAYVELFRHSGGNHGFPLLAAHGALWGAGHFRRGRIVGRVLARMVGLGTEVRRRQMAKIEGFALALKEINRRVFVETYTAYYMTERFGDDPALARFIPGSMIGALNRCHDARRNGKVLSAVERRDLFEAFFLWEQENIVGPAVDAAVAELDWPLLRFVSVRPPIGFAYFRRTEWLWFRAFDNAEERLQRGLQAFEKAERCGWEHVEKSLADYGLLPIKGAKPKRCMCRLCPA